ncbi:hypothetical protein VXQ18_06980 [Brucella abortus]|nr:hypothetical protein [Brucella abortus]
MQDIVALADKYPATCSSRFRSKTVCVRHRAAPGRLEIGLTDDAPKSLPSDIAQHLLNWTGIRWVVTVARDVAGQTIAEAEAERR